MVMKKNIKKSVIALAILGATACGGGGGGGSSTPAPTTPAPVVPSIDSLNVNSSLQQNDNGRYIVGMKTSPDELVEFTSTAGNPLFDIHTDVSGTNYSSDFDSDIYLQQCAENLDITGTLVNSLNTIMPVQVVPEGTTGVCYNNSNDISGVGEYVANFSSLLDALNDNSFPVDSKILIENYMTNFAKAKFPTISKGLENIVTSFGDNNFKAIYDAEFQFMSNGVRVYGLSDNRLGFEFDNTDGNSCAGVSGDDCLTVMPLSESQYNTIKDVFENQ